MRSARDRPILLSLPSRRALTLDLGPRDAPTLILLHSLGLDHRVWVPVAERLAQQFRIILLDLPGHGSLGAESILDELSAAADELAEILGALGLDRVAVAGLSMGGAIAQEFCLRHPTKASQLILVATLAKGLSIFEERAKIAEVGGMQAVVEATLERWFRQSDIEQDIEAVRYARSSVLHQPVGAWAAAWRALARFDARERLSYLDVPVLCIAGECDVSTPPSVLQGIANAIPSARLQIVSGAPHILTLTHPDEVSRTIADFLTRPVS